MGGWKTISDWRSGGGTTSGKWSPHKDSLHCTLPLWCLLLGSQDNGFQMIIFLILTIPYKISHQILDIVGKFIINAY